MKTETATEQLCKRYLVALNAGDLRAVRSLFTLDATVVSPPYGVRSAHDFYAELFVDTDRAETTLLDIFDIPANRAAVALRFRRVWTLASRNRVTFEHVDIFELSYNRQQFQKVTTIYDASHYL